MKTTANFWSGAVERIPPIPALHIEIIDEFLTRGQRFVACFVAPGTISNSRIRRRTTPRGLPYLKASIAWARSALLPIFSAIVILRCAKYRIAGICDQRDNETWP